MGAPAPSQGGPKAPHIHAADALAAAVSLGDAVGKPVKRKPHGKALAEMDTFDIDARSGSEPQPQLQVGAGWALEWLDSGALPLLCRSASEEQEEVPCRPSTQQSA